jgi:hypothetical protein
MVGYTRSELIRGELRWDKMTSPEYQRLDQEAIRTINQFWSLSSFREVIHLQRWEPPSGTGCGALLEQSSSKRGLFCPRPQ